MTLFGLGIGCELFMRLPFVFFFRAEWPHCWREGVKKESSRCFDSEVENSYDEDGMRSRCR